MAAAVRDARSRLVVLPLDPVVNTPNYRIESIWNVVVEIEDDDGFVGLAYLWCFSRGEAVTLTEMIRALAGHVAGSDPADRDRTLATIRRSINFLGYKGVTVFALSAIDLALTDLDLRRTGRSLLEVGPRRGPIRAYWSGLFLDTPVPALLDEVDAALARGLAAVKLRVGAPDLRDDLRRVAAVREHLPDDVPLMLDAVQRWDVPSAITAAEAFAPYAPLWLEDPLVHTDLAGLRAVVEASPVPIAAGENDYLREGFADLVATHVPIVLADLERCGGPTEWFAIAAMCGDHGAMLTSHTYPHVARHLCGVGARSSWLEYVPWWDQLMDRDMVFDNGVAQVDERPGIGLHWDPDALERYAATPWTSLLAG